jgi:hypothetical protein
MRAPVPAGAKDVLRQLNYILESGSWVVKYVISFEKECHVLRRGEGTSDMEIHDKAVLPEGPADIPPGSHSGH